MLCRQPASRVCVAPLFLKRLPLTSAVCLSVCLSAAVCLPAASLLASLSAVREASEASLTSFFGLLLDNTKVRAKTF